MEKQQKTYKYIDTDLDSNLLLTNLKHNAQKYVKFKNWDENRANSFYSALTEFEKAIEEGRLSSDQSGSITDSGGMLNNGDADWRDKNGNVLTQEQYDALKKRDKKQATKDFYANREVASYLGAIAKELYSKKIAKDKNPAEKPKFDFSKHGLWDKFVSSMAPAGTGDLEAWLNTDPIDATTKKRGTANRAKLLSDYINQYKTNLSEDIDFSDTEFNTRENYLQKLQLLQDELANGITDVDYRLINQIGGNPEEYRSFFTTNEKYTTPQEGTTNQPSEQTLNTSVPPVEDPAVKARLNDLNKRYKNAYNTAKFAHYRVSSGIPTGVKYDTTSSDTVRAYQNALNAANIRFSVENLKRSRGKEYSNYLEQYGQMNPSAFRKVEDGNYAGWYYLPESLDRNNFSVLGYNPVTHYVGRIFYGTAGTQAAQDYANILRQIDAQANQPKFQEGGALPMDYTEAQNNVYMPTDADMAAALFDNAQQELSMQTRADHRNSNPRNAANNYSDNDFTTTDYVRMGSVLADIAALVDPEPWTAGGLGLGSDIANLYADIKEGQGVWNSLGSFAGNIALSAVGLIPIIGDAAGSGTKVVKSLVKLAPKVNKILLGSGILAGVSNADEIIKSFSKIGKDGPENEMNIQDWRNVGVALQLILGGASAGRNVYAAKKAKIAKEASKTSHIDVRVKDTTTGEHKTLRFGGKNDTAALRKATTPADVNKVINTHPSARGKYEVLETTENSHAWMTTDSKWYKPWSWKQKTSKSVVAKEAVSPVYSAKKFHENFSGKGRGRYLKNNVVDKEADDFFETDFISKKKKKKNKSESNPKNETETSKSTPEENTTTNKTTTPDYTKMKSKELIQSAKKYRAGFRSTLGKPHSPEWEELVARGNSISYLRGIGVWKQGGVVRKAQKGMSFQLQPFTSPKLEQIYRQNFKMFKTPTPGFGITLDSPEIKLPFDNGRDQFKHESTPNYGTGYTSSIDYSNKEYGTTNKVNLSQIQKSNAGLRSKTLYPKHGSKEYDFTDAQANTDRARKAWQANASNRTADFMNWVTNWRTKNPNGTQADMLADYNRLIDQMYLYKREMGTPEHSGPHSYRHDDAVRTFNRTNRDIYRRANTYPKGVHGYSIPQESWNGSTTAQRFIDITDKDVPNLNFNFPEGTPKAFRNLFTGLVKDKTGRYYTLDTKVTMPELKYTGFNDSNIPLTPEYVSPQSKIDPTQTSLQSPKNRTQIDLFGMFSEAVPNALALGRYLGAKQLNKDLFNTVKQMPVMLYDPMEAHKWLVGDEQAVMAGRRAAGKLNHLASRPVTSDGNQQQAAQMEGYMKGIDYITQGEMQDAVRRNQTAEAEWQQERVNQQSRYNTTMKNRENLYQKRTNVLNALNQKKRADYESLNSLLGQLEYEARAHNEEMQSIRDSAAKASLQNDVSANMESYGIPVTASEQQMMNDLFTGNRELNSLSEEEQKSYQRLSAAIEQEVEKRMLAAKGIAYKPFIPRTPVNTTPTFDIIETLASINRQGGVLGKDSEKITIQKLRGRLKRLAIYQRQLESRLNAYEKDVDRTQRSASQYIRGQIRK